MNSIVIIGSNLVGLLTADILSKNNSVIIIEPDLELGFPANYPGRAESNQTIDEILSHENKNNLFLMEIEGFTNFRSEWFSKLLTHKLAKNNVTIMNRSRVSSINEIGKKLELSIQGSEINNSQILPVNKHNIVSAVSGPLPPPLEPLPDETQSMYNFIFCL